MATTVELPLGGVEAPEQVGVRRDQRAGVRAAEPVQRVPLGAGLEQAVLVGLAVDRHEGLGDAGERRHGDRGAADEGAVGVERFKVELDRPLRQDRCPTGGDEGCDGRIEPVAPRVAAACTRSQVNFAIRRIR